MTKMITGTKQRTIKAAVLSAENMAIKAVTMEMIPSMKALKTCIKLLKVIVSLVTLDKMEPAGVWSK